MLLVIKGSEDAKYYSYLTVPCRTLLSFVLILWTGVRAASNSAYSGYPELWILRYPAHRYHAVPSPGGFEPTTLWLRVRRPNHSAPVSCETI
jgi:hypothetical protein